MDKATQTEKFEKYSRKSPENQNDPDSETPNKDRRKKFNVLNAIISKPKLQQDDENSNDDHSSKSEDDAGYSLMESFDPLRTKTEIDDDLLDSLYLHSFELKLNPRKTIDYKHLRPEKFVRDLPKYLEGNFLAPKNNIFGWFCGCKQKMEGEIWENVRPNIFVRCWRRIFGTPYPTPDELLDSIYKHQKRWDVLLELIKSE
ncbi:uncharacterized protein LOC111613934 [Centruroides sculpturatus]|uniref:uncharacterized protein LOC111613934 n=1 Tax=Centruroides sculpturatus TaxID=218467 RepID=UPI000C6E4B7F|nr:uncharacterized protein LOC111613934 [Centruroides sculpturatus]